MFFKEYGDIIAGVFFMAFSVLMMVMAKILPKSKVMDIGPDFMPMAIGGIIFALAVTLSSGNMVRGLLAGMLGLMLTQIGMAPIDGTTPGLQGLRSTRRVSPCIGLRI